MAHSRCEHTSVHLLICLLHVHVFPFVSMLPHGPALFFSLKCRFRLCIGSVFGGTVVQLSFVVLAEPPSVLNKVHCWSNHNDTVSYLLDALQVHCGITCR